MDETKERRDRSRVVRIGVVDGQGGGIGKAIIERLRARFGDSVYILALGTNALATSLMIRSGADEGASGENAIEYNAPQMDLILGPIGIIVANSMLGELSPRAASAIAESTAEKILIPLNRCRVHIVGSEQISLPAYIEGAVEWVRRIVDAND